MTQISKYRLNTHYTGLKQLPQQYGGSFQIGGNYGYSLGVTIGRVQVNVPAGVYVETPLIRTSLDGNINHVSHEITHFINTNARVVISLGQINSSTYELKAALTNTASTTVTVPSSTVAGILRLAMAPFDL